MKENDNISANKKQSRNHMRISTFQTSNIFAFDYDQIKTFNHNQIRELKIILDKRNPIREKPNSNIKNVKSFSKSGLNNKFIQVQKSLNFQDKIIEKNIVLKMDFDIDVTKFNNQERYLI